MWQRGGVHGKGGMHGEGGHAWQGDVCRKGGCMHGGGMCSRGACVAVETVTAADSTYPTGMHSCLASSLPKTA